MPTAAERRALSFLAVVACLGGAARWQSARRLNAELERATGTSAAESGSPAERALAAQLAAVDSAREAGSDRSGRRSRRRDRAGASRESPRPPTPSRGARRRAPTTPAISGPSSAQPLEINSASASELEQLPRIGPALAKRIVTWRVRHGPFEDIDALRHVPGIGVTTAALIAPLVTFSSGSRP